MRRIPGSFSSFGLIKVPAGVHNSWWTLGQQLSTHQLVTVVLPTGNGKILKIRKGTTPEPVHSRSTPRSGCLADPLTERKGRRVSDFTSKGVRSAIRTELESPRSIRDLLNVVVWLSSDTDDCRVLHDSSGQGDDCSADSSIVHSGLRFAHARFKDNTHRKVPGRETICQRSSDDGTPNLLASSNHSNARAATDFNQPNCHVE